MKNTLARTLGLGLSAASILVGILAGSIHYYIAARAAERNLNNYKNEKINNFTKILAIHLWNIDDHTIELVCNTLLESREIVGVRVFGEENRVIFEKGIVTDSVFDDSLKQVQYDGNVIGQYEILFSEDLLWENKKNIIVTTLLVIFSIILSFIPLMQILLNRLITFPLQELEKSIGHLSRGHYDTSLPTNQKVEIQRINDAFNDMAKKLKHKTMELAKSLEQTEEKNTVLEKTKSVLTVMMGELNLEREKLEEQSKELARSNQDLEQFAYVASHDLQEPLRKIAGFTALLTRKYDHIQDPQANEYKAYIVDGTKRMKTLIQGILQYARIGRGEFSCVFFQVSDVVNEVKNQLAVMIQERKAEIFYNRLPTIYANKSGMIQVFQNLIGNGIKYCSDKHPRIDITCKEKEREWLFSVKDNGIGFDQQYAEQIFVLFKRLHTRIEFSGTGLGLALCKRIIERHGGQILAESKEGQGADFKFTLPKNILKARGRQFTGKLDIKNGVNA